MPKNKGKYKSRETATAVEPTEAVLNFWERVADQISPHRTKIVAAFAAVAVVLVALAIWSWWDRKREQGATVAFHSAIRAENGHIGDAPQLPEGLPPELMAQLAQSQDPSLPRFKTTQERSTATLAELDKLEKEYGSSDVAQRARLVKAGVLFDLGRYEDAATAYQKALGAASGALTYLAREGLALSIEAKALAEKDAAARTAGLDKALAEYKQLQPDAKGYYHDVAVFHQARVLQLKGDKPGAIALYKQIVDSMPSSPMVGEARERLERLEE